MRQLKGKPKKETSKDKKERKQAMQEARQQITTVVLPTLAVVVLLIVVFVYVATRPTITELQSSVCVCFFLAPEIDMSPHLVSGGMGHESLGISARPIPIV
uniref:Single-pass membrane and coiled-coil domain-containing protein 4 n=1 Tax=Ursus maritimus TaxID=29073 RepID=A0A452TLU0_URSMA